MSYKKLRPQVKSPPQAPKNSSISRENALLTPPSSDNASFRAVLAAPSKVACAVALALFSSLSLAEVITETITGEQTFQEDVTVTVSPGISAAQGATTTVNSDFDLTLTGSTGISTGKNSTLSINVGRLDITGSTGMSFAGGSTVVINAEAISIDTTYHGIMLSNGVDQNVTLNADLTITGTNAYFGLYGDSSGRSEDRRQFSSTKSLVVKDFSGRGAVQSWRINYYIPNIEIKDSSFSGDYGSAFMIVQGDVRGDKEENRVGTLSAHNLNVANDGAFNTLYFQEGEVNLDLIAVKDITKADQNGLLSGLTGDADSHINANRIEIDQIKGKGDNVSAYGMIAVANSSSKYAASSVDVGTVSISNIDSVNASGYGFYAEDAGVGKNKLTVDVGNLTVDGVHGKVAAWGTAVVQGATMTANAVSVRNVSSEGHAFGFQNENSSLTAGSIEISGVKGAVESSGFTNFFGTAKVDSLAVSDVSANSEQGGTAVLLDVVGGQFDLGAAALIHGRAEDLSNLTYDGLYAADASAQTQTVTSLAVRSVMGGKANLNNPDGQYVIVGTLLAGKGSADQQAEAGSISIKGNSLQIYGDVFAGNGGSIELDLGAGAILEGQVDDYHELVGLEEGTVFRNSAFKSAEDGSELAVTSAGSVKLNLNGGKWFARGQSFVDQVSFGTSGGTIDLTRNDNSSVSIGNLSGSGIFNMKLGAYSEGGTEAVQSDMLYIQNVGAGSKLTINATLADGVNVSDLEGLRFATVGTVADGHSTDLFKFVEIKDQGFNDWKLSVAKEDYATDDTDNSRFNGVDDGEGVYKPGEDVVDEIYGASNTETAILTEEEKSQNYFIGAVEKVDGGGDDNPPSEPTISDAGEAIIATARGLYYNAVEIDRFNQRYGDRRYDENNKSLWARVRHDRWGTNAGVGDFKSQNTTYQMGFDYTKPGQNGKMIYGVAVDLMDGNTDYESIDGSGETKRYAVSAYATYMGDNGGYLDVVGKVGRLSNEYAVKLDSGAGISADYMNWMAGISVEAGHQLTSDNSRWFAEPQIQAQYVFVSDNDYTNGQTRIEQDSIHSFITRAGFRAGRWLGEAKNANVYFKADVLHEWAGDQDIHVSDQTTVRGGETFSINNHGTWFDVGLGFQAPMGKSFYAYGDAEYRFGNDLYQTWTFNLGGKYVF